MKKVRFFIEVLILFLCTLGPAIAQIRGIKKGDTIKVQLKGNDEKQIVGRLESLTDTQLFIADIGYLPDYKVITLGQIDKLEVLKEVRNTGRGALIGAGTGGLTFGVIFLASYKPCGPDEWCIFDYSKGELFLMGTGFGIFTGGVIGALIGTFSKREKWKRVSLRMRNQPFKFGEISSAPSLSLRWFF